MSLTSPYNTGSSRRRQLSLAQSSRFGCADQPSTTAEPAGRLTRVAFATPVPLAACQSKRRGLTRFSSPSYTRAGWIRYLAFPSFPMKSEHRHELKTNELERIASDWGHASERYVQNTRISLIVAAVVAGGDHDRRHLLEDVGRLLRSPGLARLVRRQVDGRLRHRGRQICRNEGRSLGPASRGGGRTFQRNPSPVHRSRRGALGSEKGRRELREAHRRQDDAAGSPSNGRCSAWRVAANRCRRKTQARRRSTIRPSKPTNACSRNFPTPFTRSWPNRGSPLCAPGRPRISTPGLKLRIRNRPTARCPRISSIPPLPEDFGPGQQPSGKRPGGARPEDGATKRTRAAHRARSATSWPSPGTSPTTKPPSKRRRAAPPIPPSPASK